MKFKKTFLLLVFFMFQLTSFSQLTPPTIKWLCKLGNSNADLSGRYAIDSEGSLYFAGKFFDTLNVSCSIDSVSVIDNLYGTSYIIKYDSTGLFKWINVLGKVSVSSIYVDNNDNLFIAITGGGAYLNTYSGQVFFTDTYMKSIFLKMNKDGYCLWARGLIGTSNSDDECQIASIITDSMNNVIISGLFFGKIDFDVAYPGTFYLESALPYSTDMFIAKFDSVGLFTWVNGITDSMDVRPIFMTKDKNDDLYIVGRFTGSPDFDISSNIYTLSNNPWGSGTFLIKYDNNANLKWAKHLNNRGNAEFNHLVVDNNNDIIVNGYFTDTICPNFNDLTFYLTPNGNSNIFNVKYSSDGAYIWSNKYVGSGFVSTSSISVDSDNNIYTSIISTQSKILKCSSSSILLDSISLYGIYNSFYTIPLKANDLIIGGNFIDTLEIQIDTISYEVVSNGFSDIFFSRFSLFIDGIFETDKSNEIFIIYPNPTMGLLNIELLDNLFFPNTIEIVDITGKTVYINNDFFNEYISLDISYLKKGVYSIRIINSNSVVTKKIVKL